MNAMVDNWKTSPKKMFDFAALFKEGCTVGGLLAGVA